MDGLNVLSAPAIEEALTSIIGRWEGSEAQHAAFRSWGWAVASVCDTYASEDRSACLELMEAERAALHRVIAERLWHVHSISDELVSKRAFLAFLERLLQTPERRAA